MKRYVSIFILCSLGAFVGLAFTNCGNVDHSQYQSSPEPATKTSPRTDEFKDAINLTLEELEQIIASLPEQEQQNPRPVSDLLEQPSLATMYDCGDGSIMICHFPVENEVEDSGTYCIGHGAIPAHALNVKSYDLGEGNKTIADYLGPCRIRL